MSHGLVYLYNSKSGIYEYHDSTGVGQSSGVFNPSAPRW